MKSNYVMTVHNSEDKLLTRLWWGKAEPDSDLFKWIAAREFKRPFFISTHCIKLFHYETMSDMDSWTLVETYYRYNFDGQREYKDFWYYIGDMD